MTHDQLLSRFGEPSVERSIESGDLVIYATGPMGQWAYAAWLDGSGRVVRVAQVLTLENFARIQKGQWDEEAVLSHFGPPAARRTIQGSEVWDYRYKQDGTVNALFTVSFDATGLVSKTENGPDWLWDGGREGGRDGGRGGGHGR